MSSSVCGESLSPEKRSSIVTWNHCTLRTAPPFKSRLRADASDEKAPRMTEEEKYSLSFDEDFKVELIQKMLKAADAKLDEAQRHHMAYMTARNKFIEDERKFKKLKPLKESFGQNIDYDDSMPDAHYVIHARRK